MVMVKNDKCLLCRRFLDLIWIALIPHQKNDYRPHIIRRYGLVAVLFVIIGLQFGYNFAKTGDVLGRKSDITIASLLSQTNQVRQKENLSKLAINSKLNDAAYKKAQNMIELQYWEHDAPDGTKPWKWLGEVGYDYDQAGENLAKNFSNTEAVMDAWLKSASHKANIMNKYYSEVGFAILDGKMEGAPTSLIVAFYGDPAESSILAQKQTYAAAIDSDSRSFDTVGSFVIGFRSITPAVVVGLILLVNILIILMISYTYRCKKTKYSRMHWRRYYELYKVFGLTLFSVAIIFFYGGGQI